MTTSCPACGEVCTTHCSKNPNSTNFSHTCDWWACTRCLSYGAHGRNWVRDDRRRGPA